MRLPKYNIESCADLSVHTILCTVVHTIYCLGYENHPREIANLNYDHVKVVNLHEMTSNGGFRSCVTVLNLFKHLKQQRK